MWVLDTGATETRIVQVTSDSSASVFASGLPQWGWNPDMVFSVDGKDLFVGIRDSIYRIAPLCEHFVDHSSYGRLLFPPLCTQDASGLPGGLGQPYVFSTTTTTVRRGAHDTFYLSSDGMEFAPLVVDDAVHINNMDAGLGPYVQSVATLRMGLPIEYNLQPLPSHDVTTLIQPGQSTLLVELVDTQREIYGNTAVYILRDCGIWLSGNGPTTVNWMTHDDQIAGLPPEFDIRYGLLSQLRADRNFSRALCLGHFFDTPASDSLPNPAAGDAYYYLARGLTSCLVDGLGWYGDSSLIPDPRDTLDRMVECP